MTAPFLAIDPSWWLSAVELPALAGLFWLIQRQRDQLLQMQESASRDHRMAQQALRAALADYKLEVAQSYASIRLLKEVETRLTEHLLRIEAKLDQASMITLGGR